MKQTKTTSTDVRMHVTTLIDIRTGRRQAWCLLVAALFAAAATVLATDALERSSVANTTNALTLASSIGGKTVLANPQEKMRTELVTAFRYGFEPDAITRPEGAFMLCVDNRAGTEALSLQLTSGTYGPVYAALIERGKGGTNKELSLTPGVYILTEGSHPEWTCTITITK